MPDPAPNPAPTPAPAPAPTPAPTPAATSEAWYSGFKDEALRTNPIIQRFADPEALAASHINLNTRFGIDPARRLDLPATLDDKEAWGAVWNKLGRPEKPEGYGFTPGDGATESDKALINQFTTLAHETGVPKAHAEALFTWFTKTATDAAAAETARFEAQRVAGEARLKEAWGEAYAHKTAEIGRVLGELGGKDAEPLLAELSAAKIGNYPSLAIVLGKFLDKMAEPGTAGITGGGAGGDAPMTPDQMKAAARELDAHPAMLDRKHPQHADVVKKRNDLLVRAERPAS